MKKITYLLSAFCVGLMVMYSTPSLADGINLSSFEHSHVTMTVSPYASGENNGADYVGLTQITLASGSNVIGSFEAFCDDFNDQITTPATYNVSIQSVAGNKTLEQEAYYGSLFGSAPSGNAVLDTDIQELIWNFTAPHNEQFALNSEMRNLQFEMLTNYKSLNYTNDFYLDANGDGQSFLVVNATPISSPVPEPGSLALLGTGMLTLAGFAKRKLIA